MYTDKIEPDGTKWVQVLHNPENNEADVKKEYTAEGESIVDAHQTIQRVHFDLKWPTLDSFMLPADLHVLCVGGIYFLVSCFLKVCLKKKKNYVYIKISSLPSAINSANIPHRSLFFFQ